MRDIANNNNNKIWENNISDEFIEKLYQGLPRRINAVLQAQGGHTKY